MMRRLYVAAVVMAALAVAVFSANCQALIAIEDRHLVTDASPDCAHHQPPGPPSVTDAGGSLDLVFAIEHFEYGTTLLDSGVPRYQTIGFDLDDTCTGEGQGPSCAEPSWANASHHDGVNGIDNALGQALYAVNYAETFYPTRLTGNAVMRIRGYNGQADDDQVETCAYASPGIVPRDDGGEPFWDGQDRWRVYSGSLVAPDSGQAPDIDHPLSCDEHAYVTGGVIVSHMDDEVGPGLLILAPTYLSHWQHVVAAGRIAVGDAGRWELQDVETAFRWSLPNVIVFYSQAGMNNGQPQCLDPAQFEKVKRAWCPLADIAMDPNAPPTAPCDGISAAYVFQAKQALLGDVVDASSTLAPCAPNLDASCP